MKLDGQSFDCGSKIGSLTANLTYALARTDLGPEPLLGFRVKTADRNLIDRAGQLLP